ncbi:MAG: NUDIX domain-containing protein [bacterium]|nr:NUDIX domain-containing protein [bacterium]
MKKGVDYTGVAIVYFCHDGKGQVLMNKRGANSRDEQGRWDIGGGGVEFGIPIGENLKKEILEEYSTDVLDYEFLGFRDVHRENAGVKTHWIALDFKVLIDPTKVKNGEPHKFDEVKWFTLNTLPSPVHSQFPTFLKLYDKKLRG